MTNNKGFVLITSYMIIVVLLILGNTFVFSMTSQLQRAERGRKSLQSFYLAEAGVDYAIAQLQQAASPGQKAATSLTGLENTDTYAVNWVLDEGTQWQIDSTGTIKDGDGNISSEHKMEIVVNRTETDDFFGNAIYVDGNIEISGGAYSITGDIAYSGTFTGSDSNVSGTVTQDSSLPPLEEIFDITELQAISQAQGNVYDAERIAVENFPSAFWYGDVDDQIPNIVYIEGGVTFDSSISVPSGFFVIEGDVLLNGGTEVDGSVYTLGNLTINGGGGNIININGGVWSKDMMLNGSVDVIYNLTYMDAVKQNVDAQYVSIQVLSWKEK